MGRGCWARPRTQQATRQNERVGGGVRGERDARAGPASAACAAAEKSSAGEAPVLRPKRDDGQAQSHEHDAHKL